jgi:hypothetical protein
VRDSPHRIRQTLETTESVGTPPALSWLRFDAMGGGVYERLAPEVVVPDRSRTSRDVRAIQLVPYGRDHGNPPVTGEPTWDASETRALVKQACFDCHSNETEWPAYASIAPVSWLVQRDVNEGRAVLNFSEWPRPQQELSEHTTSFDAMVLVLEGTLTLTIGGAAVRATCALGSDWRISVSQPMDELVCCDAIRCAS